MKTRNRGQYEKAPYPCLTKKTEEKFKVVQERQKGTGRKEHKDITHRKNEEQRVAVLNSP